jgi:hypothetical protein
MNIIQNSSFWILIFLIQIFLISNISNKIFNQIYLYLYKYIRNEKIVVFIVGVMFMPGTLIHELSHAITAIFLGAKVKSFSIWPKFENNSIKLGYAEVTKLDTFRNTLIGIAPLIFGIILNYYLVQLFVISNIEVKFLLFYFIFQISNSMFLSESDTKELKILSVILIILFTVTYFFDLYYLKINLVDNFIRSEYFVLDLNLLIYLNALFFMTLVLNLFILVLIKILNRLKTY